MHITHQKNLIDSLTESYKKQINYYLSLRDIVQKILSGIVLSRGDISDVMPLFESKQKILKDVSTERERIKGEAAKWQDIKEEIPESEMKSGLEDILGQTEKVIREFLEEEQQLQTHLEHIMNKNR